VEVMDFVVDYAIFLGVAMVQGIQTGEQHDQEMEMRKRSHETDLLVRLSAQLVPDSELAGAIDGVGDGLGELVGARDVAVFVTGASGELLCVRPEIAATLDADPEKLVMAEWAYAHEAVVGSPDWLGDCRDSSPGLQPGFSHSDVIPGSCRHDVFIPLVSMSGVEGVLCVEPRETALHADCHEMATLQFVARLLASFWERKRLAADAAQVQSMREADRLKSALVSSVSHQLRTPLAAAIAAVTSLLEDGPGAYNLRRPERDEIAAVAADLQLLDEQIGRVLEYSRLEASQWRPNLEWNDLSDMCATVRAAFSPADQLRIVLDLQPKLPMVRFDFVQLSRAVHHITENALSYSPANTSVTLRALRTPGGEVRLSIEDEGEGIADDEKGVVFREFYRGAAAAKRPQGTGLGLAIAFDIIDAHGARIWIEDVEPHGARFTIGLNTDPDRASGR
jgi:two-component system sensor histidine kinase KdpD